MQSNETDTGLSLEDLAGLTGHPGRLSSPPPLGSVNLQRREIQLDRVVPKAVIDLTELPEGVSLRRITQLMDTPLREILLEHCSCPFSQESKGQDETDEKWHLEMCPYRKILKVLMQLKEQEMRVQELKIQERAAQALGQDRRPSLTAPGMQLLREATDYLYHNDFDAALDGLSEMSEADTEQVLIILSQLAQIVGAVGTQHQLVKLLKKQEQKQSGNGPIHLTINQH